MSTARTQLPLEMEPPTAKLQEDRERLKSSMTWTPYEGQPHIECELDCSRRSVSTAADRVVANAGNIAPASGDAAAGPASLQAAARSSSNEEQSPAGSSAAGSSANHQLEVRHLRKQQLRKIKQ